MIGKQIPATQVSPERARTFGDLAADLGARYALIADDWQRNVLIDWLAETPDQKWAAYTCGLSAPRQNGKNTIIELRELFGMIGRGERILHTAHQVRTAQEHFRRLKFFFGEKRNDPRARFPELNKLVERVRSVNGQEGIYLENGGQVTISARSAHTGRGMTVDVLVCDEAQDLADAELEALMPIISAAPKRNPQLIMTGTPPGPRSNGEAFARTRSDALSGDARALSWLEWSAPDGCDLDSPTVWADANPGLGTRVQMAVIEGERSRFSDEGFARERLGMWAAAVSAWVINPALWRDQGDSESIALSDLALGIDIAPDRSTASIAVAGQRADGHWHVEVDQQRVGIGWVMPYLIELFRDNPNLDARALVVDGSSQGRSIIDDLHRARIHPTITGPGDMAVACGQFFDGITEGWLHHLDQPQMNFALSVARKRSLLSGQAWGWNRKSADSDITPLVAATLALWGAQNSAVKKPRKRTNGNSRRVIVI